MCCLPGTLWILRTSSYFLNKIHHPDVGCTMQKEAIGWRKFVCAYATLNINPSSSHLGSDHSWSIWQAPVPRRQRTLPLEPFKSIYAGNGLLSHSPYHSLSRWQLLQSALGSDAVTLPPHCTTSQWIRGCLASLFAAHTQISLSLCLSVRPSVRFIWSTLWGHCLPTPATNSLDILIASDHAMLLWRAQLC